jgi:hypothetical protein
MALVLAKCQAFDNRTVGETNVRAWHEAAGDLPQAMAMRAVTRWYRDHAGEWLDPAGLRVTARTLWAEDRQARLDADHDRRLAAVDAAPRRDRAGDLAGLLRPKEHNLTLRRVDMPGTAWAWACTCGQNPTDQNHPSKDDARTAGNAHMPAPVASAA